jgi:hypothetical protein
MKLILSFFLFISSINAIEWKYLYSEPFKTRYVLAADFLKNCDEIIEIGGYKTPISDFVENKKIIVIDPIIEFKQEKDVTHLPILFQKWDRKVCTDNYGVLILGLDLLGMKEVDWQNLYDLIDKSKVTVLEFSIDYLESKEQFEKILKNVNKHIKMTLTLDLSENTYDLTNSWPPRTDRKICVLE